jgi:hypothetical protein
LYWTVKSSLTTDYGIASNLAGGNDKKKLEELCKGILKEGNHQVTTDIINKRLLNTLGWQLKRPVQLDLPLSV